MYCKSYHSKVELRYCRAVLFITKHTKNIRFLESPKNESLVKGGKSYLNTCDKKGKQKWTCSRNKYPLLVEFLPTVIVP